MNTHIETITPKQATAMLAAHAAAVANNELAQNRPVSAHHVSALAAAMAAGEWRCTHQGILIGANGAIVDGQHRLIAVVRSGTTITSMVSRMSEVAGARALPIDIRAKTRAASWIYGVDPSRWEAARALVVLAAQPLTATRLIGEDATHSATLRVAERINTLPELVRARCGGITTAQIRAMVWLAMTRQRTRDAQEELAAQYAAAVNRQVDKLWPRVASFTMQVLAVRSRGHDMDRDEQIIRAWRTFNAGPADRNRCKVSIRDAEVVHRDVRQRARDWLGDIVSAADLRAP